MKRSSSKRAVIGPAQVDLTAASKERLDSAYWSGVFVAVTFAGVFAAPAHALNPTLGWTIIGSGALLVVGLLVLRRPFYRRTRWTMIFAAGLSIFLVGSFILVGLGALSTLVSPIVFVGTALVYLAMFARVLRFYLRQHSEAWESERKHNETKALDLHAATYNFGYPFCLGLFESHPVEGLLCRIVAPIAPFVAGAPMLLVKEGREDGFWLFMAACGLSVGLVFSAMISNMWVYLRRIVHYERKLGRPIRNR